LNRHPIEAPPICIGFVIDAEPAVWERDEIAVVGPNSTDQRRRLAALA
jgi:hypothetical protein